MVEPGALFLLSDLLVIVAFFVVPNVPVLIGAGFDFGGLVVDARECALLDFDREEAVGLLSLSSDTPELRVFFRSGSGGCGELADLASEAAVGA